MKTLLVVALALVACGGSNQSSSAVNSALAGHWPLSNGAAIDINTDASGLYISAAGLAQLSTCTAHDADGHCTHLIGLSDVGALLLSCSQITGQDFVLTFNGGGQNGSACVAASGPGEVVTLSGHLSGGAFTATLNDAGVSSQVSGASSGPAWF